MKSHTEKRIGRPKGLKYPNKISVGFSEKIYGQIEYAAERFDLYLADVVRECVENDLPRLVDRKNKADKRARTQ